MLNPASGSYLIVRMPNGTTSSSTVTLPTRTLAVSVYMLGEVGPHSIGFDTGTSTVKFIDAPAAMVCAADGTGAVAVPFGAVTTACTITLCDALPWFVTVVATWTVALLADTVGVVTNVAHCAT